MLEPVKGYCPTENKEKTIYVEYLTARSMKSIEKTKGRFECDNKECKNTANCPIYQNAKNGEKISLI